MSTSECRVCGTSLTLGASQCPSCECKTPFACDVCSRPLSAVSASVPISRKHPFGAASAEGGLRCHEHRLTACRACGELSPFGAMSRREIGKHVDRETRGEKPPRVEPVFGYFCAGCGAERGAGERNGWLMGGLLLAAGVLLVGLMIFLR